MIKVSQKVKNAESLGTVTHTHTHTHIISLPNGKNIRIKIIEKMKYGTNQFRAFLL